MSNINTNALLFYTFIIMSFPISANADLPIKQFKESTMFSTIEVIVEQNGTVRLLEPLRATRPMRALLTLLEPLDKPVAATPVHHPLHDFIGVLKSSGAFNGDPVALQRAMRDEWD